MAMRKMREILRDPWFLIAAQFLLFGVIATCSIFYAYAAVSYYPTWKVVLLDVAFVFSCGALLALAWFERDPEGKEIGRAHV